MVCSLYYLMIPFLRGDEKWPVRVLFYVCWVLALLSAVIAPVIYARDCIKSDWVAFGSSIAQVTATALLFEQVGWPSLLGKGKVENKQVQRHWKA